MEFLQCLKPTTVREACSLHAKYSPRARFIAGGTDLLVQMKSREIAPEYLIDVSELSTLDYIKVENDGLRIGASTKWAALLNSVAVKEKAPIIADAARTLGSSQVRNMATIGGNICNASPAADLPVALLALDAKVKAASLSGERDSPLSEFFLGVNKTILKESELLVEVQVPPKPSRTGTSFIKLGRTSSDIALVSVAARVSVDSDGTVRDARIALGAVAPMPMRAKKAEELIRGKKLDDSVLDGVSRVAMNEARPITDLRASAAYRREIVRVLVMRALQEAVNRAN